MTDERDKRMVLLVEDDSSLRELYEIALTEAGFSTVLAENGEQGSRLALEHHPDVILLDIDMPVMNGH